MKTSNYRVSDGFINMEAISSSLSFTRDFAFRRYFKLSNRLNINTFVFTNEIRQYMSLANHRDNSGDVLHVTHVGVIDVESRSLHGSEVSLDLPPLPIIERRNFITIGTRLNNNEKAIPLYVVTGIRIFILNSLNFQLVRSMPSKRSVLKESRKNIMRVIMSRSRT